MFRISAESWTIGQPIAKRRTFDEAEKLARKRVAQGKEPQVIVGDIPHTLPIARIVTDAFGRVWTDLTPYGAMLV